MSYFTEFSQYMPHGMCLLWQPWLLVLWAGSDALIFLSYMAIPIALFSVIRARGDIPHVRLLVLFSSFILLCGLTHLLGIVTLWVPIYPTVGIVKLLTGLVSMTTAIVLFRLVPTLVALPSPDEHADTNARLREEIAAHEATLASLESAVELRTAELNRVNARLAVQAREAVHRSGNLLAVVASLAQQSARGADSLESFLTSFSGRIQALASATRSVMQGSDQSSGDMESIVAAGLKPVEEAYGERVSYAGPPLRITSEAAQQISLALHELATNTQKYGLATSEVAHVEVNWTNVERDGKEMLDFVWREYGGAAKAQANEKREGFGSKLLTRIVPAMLRGHADRDFQDGEMVYRLTVPLEAILSEQDASEEDGMAARIIDKTFGLA